MHTDLRVMGAALLVCVLSVPIAAQDQVAHVEISGTSTVRGWTCPAEGVLSATPGTGTAPLPGLSAGVGPVTLRFQVAEIECPEEQMKEHLQEALEAPAFPEIVYTLHTYAVDGDDGAQASGEITIHGVTQPLALEIDFEESADGIRGIGRTELDITEFGLTPPSLWLGMLNVGAIIQIEFNAPIPVAQ
jgi:polyisoprenoid-binding protein YceI